MLHEFVKELSDLLAKEEDYDLALDENDALENENVALSNEVERLSGAIEIADGRNADLQKENMFLQDHIAELEKQLAAVPAPQPEPEPAPVPPPAASIPDVAFDQKAYVWPPAPAELPPAGKWFRDPVFGTAIMRLPDGIRHTYSQLQPFSRDNQRFIGYNVNSGSYGILNLDGKAPEFKTFSASYPRWAKNDVIFDIQSNKILHGSEAAVYEGSSIMTASSAEMTDAAGEHVAFVDQADQVTVIRLEGLEPLYSFEVDDLINWVRVHPAGPEHGVLAQYDNARTVWYRKDGSLRATIAKNNRHSDVRIKGKDGFRYVYQEDYIGGHENSLVYVDSDNLDLRQPVVNTPSWGRMMHISCTGPHEVVSAGIRYNKYEKDKELKGEIWMYDPSIGTEYKIRRICHHRSSIRDYWAQPHAAQSSDGRYVAFASDWGTNEHYGFIADLSQ